MARDETKSIFDLLVDYRKITRRECLVSCCVSQPNDFCEV